jgi:hypothetical protein
VQPKVFDNILANLGFLSGKGEKEAGFFHTILLSWSSQQEIIYILEWAAMLVSQESLWQSQR